MQRFSPSDSRLRYMGRIDTAEADAPVFYWPGSLVRIAFQGSELRLRIENHRYDPASENGRQLGIVLDGREQLLKLNPENDLPQDYTVNAADAGSHSLTLFKREDCTHYFRLLGLEAEMLTDAGDLPARRIECYGDSVSAGAVCEAHANVGQVDPPGYTAIYDNAWHSYAMQTARLLHTQIYLNAQGGIALLDNTGYFENGRYGMETAYDKLCYQPGAGELTQWDFARYTPHVVLFAIGQNDHHVGEQDNCVPDAAKREHWLQTYCGIIGTLMERYPKATFVLLLTVLQHDEYWEQMLDAACERIGSPRVKRFRFTRGGKATPGHPRVAEQCEMACELTEYLDAMGEEIWQS